MPPLRLMIISTFTAVALATVISPVAAQPAGPGWWGPGMMMGPGMMNWRIMGRGICNPQAAGLAEWRSDAIEHAVQPTEAQRLALAELKAASTKAMEIISAACPRELPQSLAARLEVMEKRLDAMLEAVKTVRPAFDALYASVNDKQRTSVA